MKKQITISNLVSCISPVIILGVSFWGYKVLVAQKEAPPQKEQEEVIPVVETIPLQLFDGHLSINLDGTVTPLREITISAEVAGNVEQKSSRCRAGKYLSPDTFLLKIDSRDYDIEFNQTIKDLEEAAVVLKELEVEQKNNDELLEIAKKEMKLQQKEVARVTKLKDQKVISDTQFDKTNQALLTSERNVEMQLNQRRLLGTKRFRLYRTGEKILLRLKKASLETQRTTINSPVQGVVVKDLVEQGEYVRKGDPLITIEETSAVEILCHLKMDELYWIRQQATLVQQPKQTKSIPKEKKTVAENFNKQVADHERLTQKLDQLLAQVTGEKFDDIHKPLMSLIEQYLEEESAADERSHQYTNQISDATSPQIRAYELPPTPVEVTYRLNDELFTWEGLLSRFDGAGLDEKTRTIPCRVIVKKPLQATVATQKGLPALVRGMFVSLTIQVKTDIPLFRIPINAIQPGSEIWLVNKEKLHIKPVSIVHQTNEYALVRVDNSNLVEGEVIIVSPLAAVEEGLPVKVRSIK